MNELTQWLLLLLAWLAAVASLTVAFDRFLLRMALIVVFGFAAGFAMELDIASWRDLVVGFVTGAVAVAAYRRLRAYRTTAVGA